MKKVSLCHKSSPESNDTDVIVGRGRENGDCQNDEDSEVDMIARNRQQKHRGKVNLLKSLRCRWRRCKDKGRCEGSVSDSCESVNRPSRKVCPVQCAHREVSPARTFADLNANCSSSKVLGSHGSLCENLVLPCTDVACDSPKLSSLTRELFKLSKYGWYWGPITRSEAEEKLANQPDGAFLVRDSSDDRYLLSLSFRSYGKTLHTRIEHSGGLFSFYAQSEPEGHTSIAELIQQSMNYSRSGVFCYSRGRSPASPSFPVRLTKPVSRFTQVRSLQYLCRFVIRQYTRFDHIQQLPLPPRIRGYIEEGHY